VAETLGIPIPDTRNPFAGKGLAVTTALLVGGGTPWSLGRLAEAADVSRPLVSKVVRKLIQLDLVAGEVEQGRDAAVRARPELFDETALHWPAPVASMQGGRPPSDDVARGGGELARERLGVLWQSPPRVYLRSLEVARRFVALAGGAVVSEPVAEWEIAVVHFPFEPGPVPTIVAALELGRTPRGRELLDEVRTRLFDGWDAT
jgi:hypothetical protein